MKFGRLCGFLTASAFAVCAIFQINAFADDSAVHDTSRDIQTEGVGNPYNFGERNTPENASAAEIRAINHKMTVQEVKYALYKEIDEHWDLISTRFGQPEREKVYALMLGLGTRESTLGGNGDGADIETAFSQGFGVSSAHAYGTMQTAPTWAIFSRTAGAPLGSSTSSRSTCRILPSKMVSDFRVFSRSLS